jgi:hypothetical protein
MIELSQCQDRESTKIRRQLPVPLDDTVADRIRYLEIENEEGQL